MPNVDRALDLQAVVDERREQRQVLPLCDAVTHDTGTADARAKRLKKRSSGPKISAGRTMVASGNASSTSFSPDACAQHQHRAQRMRLGHVDAELALARRNWDGDCRSAPRADTCTSRSTPACWHAWAITRAPWMLTSSIEKWLRRVKGALPRRRQPKPRVEVLPDQVDDHVAVLHQARHGCGIQQLKRLCGGERGMASRLPT